MAVYILLSMGCVRIWGRVSGGADELPGVIPALAQILRPQGEHVLGTAASAGDPVANEVIRHSGRMIGAMLAGVVNFFDPRLILIGGGVSKIGFQLLASIRQAVLHRSTALSTRALRIEYSQLGDDAGVVGAIQLALEYVFVVGDQRPE